MGMSEPFYKRVPTPPKIFDGVLHEFFDIA